MGMKGMEKMESFVREVVEAMRCGSWQFAKEMETERLLFPEAYVMRKRMKGELEKGAVR